jgi:hypothetical protein
MRIGGGGGRPPRMGGAGSAQGAGKAQGAAATQKADKAGFAGMVDRAPTSTDEPSKMKSAIMQELAELAAELEAGKATKEEASRRFVGMVIKRRFGGKKGGKGEEKMEEVIGDMVESDPQFIQRLQSQLKRIAKG